MAAVEQAKEWIERTTGMGRPRRSDLAGLIRTTKPRTYRFRDDGRTPNNPRLPLVIYPSVLGFSSAFDPAAVVEEVFASNGWKQSWRDSIYRFLHFHAATHEALGIAKGSARVQFGGSRGRVVSLKAGDVIVIPAGTGHRRLSTERDLLVVGAYPAHGRYDEPRPREIDHEEAKASIVKVRLPAKDPVYGKHGPLREFWSVTAR